MNTPDLWNDTERELLDAVLDQIIPASADGRIPAAGALGVADFIGRNVAGDVELGALFRQGLAKAAVLVSAHDAHVDVRIVARIEQEEPAFFEALLRQTYMGYYSRGDVRALFGLSPKPTQPDGYDVPPDDPEEMAALIEPVKKRGSCYRVA